MSTNYPSQSTKYKKHLGANIKIVYEQMQMNPFCDLHNGFNMIGGNSLHTLDLKERRYFGYSSISFSLKKHKCQFSRHGSENEVEGGTCSLNTFSVLTCIWKLLMVFHWEVITEIYLFLLKNSKQTKQTSKNTHRNTKQTKQQQQNHQNHYTGTC